MKDREHIYMVKTKVIAFVCEGIITNYKNNGAHFRIKHCLHSHFISLKKNEPVIQDVRTQVTLKYTSFLCSNLERHSFSLSTRECSLSMVHQICESAKILQY